MKLSICLLMLGLLSTNLYASSLALKDKEQLKDYTLKHCQLEKQSECDCIANQMLELFSKKDWRIFIASINKNESIRQHVSAQDIFNFSDKIYKTSISCGIE